MPSKTKPAKTGSTQRAPKGADPKPHRSHPGRKPDPIIEFPEPLWEVWEDPAGLADALDLHMRRHGDTAYRLHKVLLSLGFAVEKTTLASWRAGTKAPRALESLEILSAIEHRYRLPKGYLRAKEPHPARASTGYHLPGVEAAESRRLAWHLPDDFNQRPRAERNRILDWVRTNIVTGATEYRRYHAGAIKQRFGLRFSGTPATAGRSIADLDGEDLDATEPSDFDPDWRYGAVPAPARLDQEMGELLRFKTSTLTDIGFQRRGVWGSETAAQKVEHLGLLFGALAASPSSVVKGRGVPISRLCFALLVFPQVWDWYVQWREQRRGFYTSWEVDQLLIGAALTRQETGWLRQRPDMARRLQAIPGLLSAAEIKDAQSDWDATCERLHRHVLTRAKEIERVARVHRDPFEPILPILEADSPVGEYRKIAEEILRRRPDARRYPRDAAEATRSFLIVRLGLHLGLRQKNLRQLLVCQRGRAPTPERTLETLRRGELRWSERDAGWEVLIPASAFKNARSSYFSGRPFRIVLPDLAGLYGEIDAYLEVHRARLLNGAADPGTLFIKTVKATSRNAAFDQHTFYEAWRLIIQRYGIYNPFTGRGVIKGLLPHGPHNVRDVLATHILKRTGSYEQASYAIQDTPETVAHHYGRFLPQDKAALAAQVLNKVWEAA